MSHDIRREYDAPPLLVGPDDPLDLFQEWFDEACAAKDIPDPTAFVLATLDIAGHPDARVLLLKQARPKEFVFYTNYYSEKGWQMHYHRHVAMNFYWPSFSRQVRITGVVSKISREASEQYFASRPKASQAAATVSKQSQVVDRAMLHRQFQAALTQETIPCPDYWGGYEVTPKTIEFWHGQAGRLHDRIAYVSEKNGWRQCCLAP